MKDGTLYATKLKRAYTKLRQSGIVAPNETEAEDDPIRRLALSILGEDCGEAEAAAALERLFSVMVDWNEIRVSTAEQVQRAAGLKVADAVDRTHRLTKALHAIYLTDHRIALDRLKNMGRREARQLLESMPGINDYAAAAVMLWSFGGHAIPVNDALLQALREAELVHPQATRVEVQAFLERNVPAAQTKEFCAVIRGLKPGKPRGAASPIRGSKSARKPEKSVPK